MECKYAYTKVGVKYVLCKCHGKVKSNDMKEIAHCMCGHQRFCREIKKCALLPSWIHCRVKKEAEEAEAAEMAAIVEVPETKGKTSTRKKKE